MLLETWQKVDHYEVLGVNSSASDQELKQAYRKACLRPGELHHGLILDRFFFATLKQKRGCEVVK